MFPRVSEPIFAKRVHCLGICGGVYSDSGSLSYPHSGSVLGGQVVFRFRCVLTSGIPVPKYQNGTVRNAAVYPTISALCLTGGVKIKSPPV